MLSKVQIDYVFSLPPEVDFRFEESFGETRVIVRQANGSIVHVNEDGGILTISQSGTCSFWKHEPVLYGGSVD